MATTEIVEVGPIPIELVNVEELSVDKRYQRRLRQPFVEKIATRWDWRLCGVLTVNERNGRRLVVDGQHRLAAAKMAGIAAVPCLLMSETALEEPRIFVDLQEARQNVSSVEKHLALVAAKDAEALSVDAAVKEAGCSIALSATRLQTTAAKACYDIYRRGGSQHLTDVFIVCRKAWPFSNLPQTNILQGLSVFLAAPFRHRVDLERLVQHLGATTPKAIALDAKSYNSTSATKVARELVSIYNRSIDGHMRGRASLDAAAIQRKGKKPA